MLLGAPGIATGNKNATRNKCIATRNKCLTSSNKKLLGAPGIATRSMSFSKQQRLDGPDGPDGPDLWP